MKIALCLAFVCLAAALPSARQVQNLSNPKRIPGEFLVVLHPKDGRLTNAQYTEDVASRISAVSPQISVLKRFDSLRHPILYVKTSDEAVMSQLFQLPEVSIIESNLYEKMIEQCESQATGSRLWGLSRVASRDQPDYSDATYSYSSSEGSNVNVYVLDTSVRLTHQEFTDRGEFGENFAGGSNDDGNGHGTHCAGTVLGSEFGVAKGATVIAVKVLNALGFGSTEGIVNGINWMVGDVASRGMRGVGSMSLGGSINEAMDSAVNDAAAAGVPVVVAAGNNNGDACDISPARADGAITVGSTDNTDTLSSFSNWGTCVDVLAPGSDILSASNLSDDGSRSLSGTSMACPHVAGLAAKYLSDNPEATPEDVRAFLASSATQGAIDLRGTSGTPNLLMYSTCA